MGLLGVLPGRQGGTGDKAPLIEPDMLNVPSKPSAACVNLCWLG